MDKGRVGACYRTENKRRKFLWVINDVVRAKWATYNEFLTREAEGTDCRYEKSKRYVRRALVRQRVLQQCMKARKDALRQSDHDSLFGRYGGKPVDAFSREIEGYIAENHPKVRRVRKIQELMDKSLATGAILDKQVTAAKMASFFERSLTKMRLKRLKRDKTQLPEVKTPKKEQKPRNGLPKLPILTNPFYAKLASEEKDSPRETISVNVLSLSTDMEKLSLQEARSIVNAGPEGSIVRREKGPRLRETPVLPNIKEDKTKDRPKQKEGAQLPKERATLVLPPIQPTKELFAK